MNLRPCKEGCPLCRSSKRILIDPNILRPSILSEEDCCDRFHCRSEGINKFILSEAKAFQEEMLGTTYLFSSNGEIIAFVTLQMAEIKRDSLSRKDRLQIGKDRYPAVQIGQLAVHVDYEDNDIGTHILDWSIGKAMRISEQIGCRFVVLNAEREVMAFYEKYGFRMLPKQDSRIYPFMFLDLRVHVGQ
jgi:predicted GNAT family N-acyltransferase